MSHFWPTDNSKKSPKIIEFKNQKLSLNLGDLGFNPEDTGRIT